MADWVPLVGYGVINNVVVDSNYPSLFYPIIRPNAGGTDDAGLPLGTTEQAAVIGAIEGDTHYKVHRIVGQIAFGYDNPEGPDTSCMALLRLVLGLYDPTGPIVQTVAGGLYTPNPLSVNGPWQSPVTNPMILSASFAALIANQDFWWQRIYWLQDPFSVYDWGVNLPHPWWTHIDIPIKRRTPLNGVTEVLGFELGFEPGINDGSVQILHHLRALVSL